MALVKNLRGSGKRFPAPTCACETWIHHWEANKGFKAQRCRCCGQRTSNLVGGHVIKVQSPDASRYIVPLCEECNSPYNDKAFYVQDSDLVSANCDRCKNKKAH